MTNFDKKPASFKLFEQDLDEETSKLFSSQRALAIDTEAMGLIHGRDRLCLVQICDDKDNVCCIKISKGQENAPKVQSLMENNNIHHFRFHL